MENGFESITTPEEKQRSIAPGALQTDAVRPDPLPSEPADPTGEIAMDAEVARGLFDQIVIEHAKPVREFMIEVRLGEPLRAWVDFAMPALKAILRSAQGMGIADFVAKLEAYLKALEFAQTGTDRLIRGQVRQGVIDAYSELTAFMPDAFALESEANKRESIIVHSLLQQVPGIHKVSTDRIYGAGLTSLALFYVARPTDIAELTGIPMTLADSVVNRFKDYRKKIESVTPEHNRAAELSSLTDVTMQLAQASEEYDKQAPGAAGDARKRELRRVRGDLMVELGLLLARLGEVEFLRDLEKQPFSSRADLIFKFIEQAKAKGQP